MRTMPSTTENSEWTRKWTKEAGMAEFMNRIVLKVGPNETRGGPGLAQGVQARGRALGHAGTLTLDRRPGLLQALYRHRHRGAQLLGEQGHAQFFQQPAEFIQARVGRPLQGGAGT